MIEPTIEQAQEQEDRVEALGLNIRDSRTVILRNGLSLWWFIKEHFDYIKAIEQRLCVTAMERWGPEGWRKVSFEGIGLFVAIHEFGLNLAKHQRYAKVKP